MHEQLKSFNQNKFKNQTGSSKYNTKKLVHGNADEESDRFEDITNLSISGNDGHEKMFAG